MMNNIQEIHDCEIVFIQPSQIMDNGEIWKSKMPWLPRLSLPQLAAITPDYIKTSIIDEYVEDIDFNINADLVAISATTVQAPRAYQIAQNFRNQGIKTIMGGIHASLLPEEASMYADSLLIGEAEVLWQEVVKDLHEGKLKPRYENSASKLDINHIPSPELSKLNLSRYKVPFRPVQTTRGCPHNCEYCSVTKFFGKSFRHRDIDDIVREIEELKSQYVFFVDDNIAANPKRAKELFKAIKPLGIRWASQCCMSIAYDDELLELARDSGCAVLMLGFESLSSQSLESVNKTINKVDDYYFVVNKLHQAGISVMGFIVFGFDYDDESVFEKTLNFMNNANVDFPCYWILTPYPNTPLYEKLNSEGRIIERDWSKYDCSHVVFNPKLMSPEILANGYKYAYKNSYSLKNIAKRMCNISNSSKHMAERLFIKGDIFATLGHLALFRHGARKGYHPMMG